MVKCHKSFGFHRLRSDVQPADQSGADSPQNAFTWFPSSAWEPSSCQALLGFGEAEPRENVFPSKSLGTR